MKRLFLATLSIVSFLILSSCQETIQTEKSETSHALIDGHPSWIMQGNIYEVNIRQYTPEGTFNAFARHLERLKEMGVQTLWFMPLNPISKVDRKGALGSYYAVSSYYAINPEFGTLDDWKALVNKAHALGFKIVIDWVPNHSGADHEWLTSHPDFYMRDSITGKALSTFDWTDTRELNYDNAAMRDSMIASMKYWIRETDIDGYRVDVAWGVPDDFWKRCLKELREMKSDLFLLAEADGGNYHVDGFDASYPWTIFQMMKKVASGERNALALDTVIQQMDTSFPANAIRLYFTSNHDENSWNKADFGTMPGPKHAPFAVFTQTYARSVPLIYSGQEEPVLDSISFFYKDTIHFKKLARAGFYKTLLNLRKTNPAMAANVPARKIKAGDEKSVFAYLRETEGGKVLVILNLSAQEQTIKIQDKNLHGTPFNLFMGTREPLNENEWKLEPWGYVVYTY